MARVVLDFGAEIDILNRDELHGELDNAVRSFTRGIDYRRLPRLRGVIAGGAVTMGDGSDGNSTVGPESGNAWSITRLAVDGLKGGATPDVLAFYRNGATSARVWQLDGNNWFDRFSRLQLVLKNGETLVAAGSALTATGTVTVTGELIEVPEEMLGKLA